MGLIPEIFAVDSPPTKLGGWNVDCVPGTPVAAGEKTKHRKLELISEILAAVGGTHFADSLEQITKGKGLFESEWVPYHGPNGGKGRKNIKTGKIEYGEFQMRPPAPSSGNLYRGAAPYVGMSDAFFGVLKKKGNRADEVAKNPELFNEMFAETQKNSSLKFSKEHFADFVKGFLNFKPRKLTKTEQRKLGFGTLTDEDRERSTQMLFAAKEVNHSIMSGVKSPAHAKALLDRMTRFSMNQLLEMRAGIDSHIDPEAQRKVLNSIGLAALVVAGAAITGATAYAGWKLLKQTPKLLRKSLRWLKSELDKVDGHVQEAEEIVDKRDVERKQLMLDRLNRIADILYGVYGTHILNYLDEINDSEPEPNIEEAFQEVEESYSGMKTITDKNGRRYEVEFLNGKPVKGHKKVSELNQKHAEDHPRTEYQLNRLANDLAQVSQHTQPMSANHAAETVRLMAHVSPVQLEQLHHQFGSGVTKKERESVIKRIAKFAVKAGIVLAVTVPAMLALDYVGQKLIDKMPEGAFWMLMDDMSGSLKKIKQSTVERIGDVAPHGIKVNIEGIKAKQADDKELEEWNAKPEWKKFLQKVSGSAPVGAYEVKEAVQESVIPNDFSGLLEVLVEGEVKYRRYRNGLQIPLEQGYRPDMA